MRDDDTALVVAETFVVEKSRDGRVYEIVTVHPDGTVETEQKGAADAADECGT